MVGFLICGSLWHLSLRLCLVCLALRTCVSHNISDSLALSFCVHVHLPPAGSNSPRFCASINLSLSLTPSLTHPPFPILCLPGMLQIPLQAPQPPPAKAGVALPENTPADVDEPRVEASTWVIYGTIWLRISDHSSLASYSSTCLSAEVLSCMCRSLSAQLGRCQNVISASSEPAATYWKRNEQ